MDAQMGTNIGLFSSSYMYSHIELMWGTRQDEIVMTSPVMDISCSPGYGELTECKTNVPG